MLSVEPITGLQSVRPCLVVLTLTGWFGAPVIKISKWSPILKSVLEGRLELSRRTSGLCAITGTIAKTKMASTRINPPV
jgi:hypothetical protein